MEILILDLIKVISFDNFFDILSFLRDHPGQNPSYIASQLKVHIVTIQRVLDVLEKYGFATTEEKRGIGRPSKNYSFAGGKFTVDLNELLSLYRTRLRTIRESGNPSVSFSYDIDKELVNALLIGGKTGKKIKLDEKSGRFLWLVPSPDATAESIESIANKAGMAVHYAIQFTEMLISLKVIEEDGMV